MHGMYRDSLPVILAYWDTTLRNSSLNSTIAKLENYNSWKLQVWLEFWGSYPKTLG